MNLSRKAQKREVVVFARSSFCTVFPHIRLKCLDSSSCTRLKIQHDETDRACKYRQYIEVLLRHIQVQFHLLRLKIIILNSDCTNVMLCTACC